ncbi:SDR family NAD(P)-dependent oxidoreductase [Actinopolymorpha sp. B9G3]|uniref:SDR family NAD(P)-dependent oxidoreductase n=1 Tax=Actinopolymorpha sp. B9G3 TaxID=3158970 RepID=UPI0032D8C678
MRRFEDRVAFITGAAHGIGRATAQRLAREGASVVVSDIEADAADKVASALAGDGSRALALCCDVARPDQVEAAIAAAVDRFGRLDVLVNNVGVATDTAFEDLGEEEWQRQVDPTLGGAVRCIQAALPHLLAAPGGGAVVSVGSINALAAFGNEAYSAAKAGLVSLTQNLAMRYARRGVRFNLVAPGTVRTRIWERRLAKDPSVLERMTSLYPLGRIGEPEDIAAAIAFLASSDAAWVTGTVLRVDGGVLAGHTGFLREVFE